MFELWGQIDWKSFFGRSGLNSNVFEKLYISYSCILFIKQCALRSFYIKMLCFSKNLFFQIFNRSNLLLDRSKMRLKFWIQFSWHDRCSIGAGSIEIDFRLIQSNFRPIKNWSKSFLKQAWNHAYFFILPYWMQIFFPLLKLHLIFFLCMYVLCFFKHKILWYTLTCSWLASKQWWDGYLYIDRKSVV